MVTAKRKVRFFRATDGDLKAITGGFPAQQVHRNLRTLVASRRAEVGIGAGQKLVAKALKAPRRSRGRHLVLYKVSHDDLPLLYDQGTFQPLADVINATTNLAEPAHFAFFPDDIVAHLYNHNGPKERNLAAYLATTMDMDVLFGAVPREDVLQSIAEAGGVKLFDLRLRVETAALLNGMPLRGMQILSEEYTTADVEVILRATTPAERRSLGALMVNVGWFLQRAGGRRAVRRAKVALDDTDELSEDRLVDLLDDKLGLTELVETVPGQKRYLEESSAMSALEDAYDKVAGRL